MANKIWIILFLLSGVMSAQQFSVKTAFLEKWKNSKEYFLKIAEQKPEDKYEFKHSASEMMFKEQLLHIRQNMLWLGTTYFSKEKFDKEALEKNIPQKKTEIIKSLENAFDKVYNQVKDNTTDDLQVEVDFFAGRKSKLQI